MTHDAFVDRPDLSAADWRALFQAFGDSNLDAIICIASDGIVVEWSRGAVEIFGWTKEQALGARIDALIVPAEMVAAHTAAMARYLATGETSIIGRRVEIEAVRRDETRFPVEIAVAPLLLRGDTFFVARIRDISARRRRERQLEMVAREMDHRTKNALAVMSAIAKLSARSADADDVDGFVRVFTDRIEAYRVAHELLGESRYEGVELGRLYDTEIRPFRPGLEGVTIGGPKVLLPPRAALTLGMCVHETATNAAKHGALSMPDGRVDIAWHLTEADLIINWIETGGPPVLETPTHRGFGSQLIQVGLKGDLNGSFTLAFPRTGMVGQVRVPLSSLCEA